MGHVLMHHHGAHDQRLVSHDTIMIRAVPCTFLGLADCIFCVHFYCVRVEYGRNMRHCTVYMYP